jgi:hypothetical protein
MADSLSDARDALRRDEPGEAIVHLWNAFEEARGLGEARAFGQITRLAREAKSQGDEGERAEADRLLRELGEDEPDFGVEEEWVPPVGDRVTPEPPPGPVRETGFETLDAEPLPGSEAELPPEEEEQPKKRGTALPFLIALAAFLFFTIRDNL